MYLVERNTAVATNPPVGTDIHITEDGSSWYWTAFTLLTVATIAFIGLGTRKVASARLFHHTSAAITAIGAVAYFTLASDLGFTGIAVEFFRPGTITAGSVRQIFWVRYVLSFLTGPLVLFNLFATAGLRWQNFVKLLVVQEFATVNYLGGALVRSRYKWGYYTFGLVSTLYILYNIAHPVRNKASAIGTDVSRAYTFPAGVILVTWLLYPIAWGVSEGGNVIHPDSEAAFYGVLDVLSLGVASALLVWGHRDIEPARLGYQIRNVEDRERPRREKHEVRETT